MQETAANYGRETDREGGNEFMQGFPKAYSMMQPTMMSARQSIGYAREGEGMPAGYTTNPQMVQDNVVNYCSYPQPNEAAAYAPAYMSHMPPQPDIQSERYYMDQAALNVFYRIPHSSFLTSYSTNN